MTSVFCVICCDDEHAEWVALPCGHVCHQNCLTTWFNHNQNCPSCRREPNGEAIRRIYFDSPQQERPALSPAAAAAEPTDTQEVQQLCGLLFNEMQERQAAWHQAHESEKLAYRLRMEGQDIRREAQRLEEQLASRRSEMTQILQLLELKESEIGILKQNLEFEEQQNRELNCALVAQEESNLLSVASYESRQMQLIEEIESEKRLRGQDSEVIKNLTLVNSQLIEQNRMAEQEARNMGSRNMGATLKIEQLQAGQLKLEESIRVLTMVKDSCTEELNQEKQYRLQDAERMASLTRQAEQNAANTTSLVAELTLQKQSRDVAERKNQQLIEVYARLKATANEKVNEQKAMILTALKKQTVLENEKEAIRRLLLDKETEIADLQSKLKNESADFIKITDNRGNTEVDLARTEILRYGTKEEDDNFADFSILQVSGPVDVPSPSVYVDPTLEEAEGCYTDDSFVALGQPALWLKQPESVCYLNIANLSGQSVANRSDQTPNDKYNETEVKGRQQSTLPKPPPRNSSSRPQINSDEFAPTNPTNAAGMRLLYGSSSELYVRDPMMPCGNPHLQRTKSSTNLSLADLWVSTRRARTQKTRSQQADAEEEKQGPAGKKNSKLGKEKSRKGGCKQM